MGAPILEENLLSISAIETSDYSTASAVFDELRSEPYITTRGERGIELDNSEFGALADVLHDECDWDPYEIKRRLKHYEGWDDHQWA